MNCADLPAARDAGAPSRGAALLRGFVRKRGTTYTWYLDTYDPETGKRKNLGTFDTREQAEKHERAVQYFKRKG